jgi:hypothetical protein
MPKQISKAQAIEKLEAERRRLEQNLAKLSQDDMIQPGVVGEWSVKDVLAHLASWEQFFLDWYAADQRGETPHPPAPGLTWRPRDLDILNQRIFVKHRGRSLSKILAEFRNAHKRFMATVEAIPGKDIIANGHFTWIGKAAMYSWLTAYASHDRWAKTKVREWIKAHQQSKNS